LALSPLTAASWLFGGAAVVQRKTYERGWRRSARLSTRVVCVGDLLIGGTGKTLLTAWVAAELRRRGHKVVLACAGTGGRRDQAVLVVSDGRYVCSESGAAGDEPMVLVGAVPGVPVLVGRDPVQVGLRALSAFSADVLVLDGGFQHHRLRRDIDLVTFDGAQGLGSGYCLPRGPLREPIRGLARADAVGVTDGPLPALDAARITRAAPGAFRFEVRRRPRSLRPLAGGAGEEPERLAGRAVGLLSGLALPDPFRRTVESLGALVVAERRFGDHHRYRPRDLRGLAQQAPLWVTTEKDAVKIPSAWAGPADVRVLAIEADVQDPRALGDWLEDRLR
jgi:tetraacyldisaccharide 4'-kinase